MTVTAEADTMTSADVNAGPRCQVCGGPCWQYKGSEHGYTCTPCLDAYLDAGAAKGAERDRKAREKLARTLIRKEDFTAVSGNGRRRDGGVCSYVPPAVPASAIAAATTSTADQRETDRR